LRKKSPDKKKQKEPESRLQKKVTPFGLSHKDRRLLRVRKKPAGKGKKVWIIICSKKAEMNATPQSRR